MPSGNKKVAHILKQTCDLLITTRHERGRFCNTKLISVKHCFKHFNYFDLLYPFSLHLRPFSSNL